MKKLFLVLAVFLLGACAQLPTANGEIAQAVSSADVVTQATEVGKVMYQDVNVPLWMVGIAMLAAWCVRTPWGLISDFLRVRKLSG